MKDIGQPNMKVIQAVAKKIAHVTCARTASQTGNFAATYIREETAETRNALQINPVWVKQLSP